jgi:hypothetical protein
LSGENKVDLLVYYYFQFKVATVHALEIEIALNLNQGGVEEQMGRSGGVAGMLFLIRSIACNTCTEVPKSMRRPPKQFLYPLLPLLQVIELRHLSLQAYLTKQIMQSRTQIFPSQSKQVLH